MKESKLQRAEKVVHKKEVYSVLMTKRGGAHSKSNKAKRQAEKRQWKNEE